MSNLGNNFDRAQRAYDNMSPPEDEELLRLCDQCGEEYEYTVDKEGDVECSICPDCVKKNEEEEE